MMQLQGKRPGWSHHLLDQHLGGAMTSDLLGEGM
jgi:hypothetical protein